MPMAITSGISSKGGAKKFKAVLDKAEQARRLKGEGWIHGRQIPGRNAGRGGCRG